MCRPQQSELSSFKTLSMTTNELLAGATAGIQQVLAQLQATV